MQPKLKYAISMENRWRFEAETPLAYLGQSSDKPWLGLFGLHDRVLALGCEEVIFPGRIYVIYGPSGSGKDSACNTLQKQHVWRKILTVATRPPRPGEEPGKDSWFVTPEEFSRLDSAGYVGEKTEYIGNQLVYGVFWKDIFEALCADQANFIIVDHIGLLRFREIAPANTKGIAFTATRETLRQRMLQRGDDLPSIEKRLSKLDQELQNISTHFDVMMPVDCDTPQVQAHRLLSQVEMFESRTAQVI